MIGRRAGVREMAVSRRRDGETRSVRDAVAVEEPLEIRVAWSDPTAGRRVEAVAVTMRTPGDDFELVAGFLHGEGIVTDGRDIDELTYCRGGATQEYNVVEARLAAAVSFSLEHVRRNVYTSSSCGVCGKASLEAVEAVACRRVASGPVLPHTLLSGMPDRLLGEQSAFARTGGLHAAGLFDGSGEPIVVREDVGRHNAVDKVVGHRLLERPPDPIAALVVSGRASFELVQKAVLAGIPIMVAVGAPSSLAVDLARRFDQTLLGFTRDGGFNVYSGEERVA